MLVTVFCLFGFNNVGSAQPGTSGINGTNASLGGRFYHPRGIAIDSSSSNLYVADTHNHTIRKIVLSTGAVTTLAGTAGASGSADGKGAAARFNEPHDVAIDSTDTNLYIVDGGQTVRKIVLATDVVTTIAGKAEVAGDSNGKGAEARFFRPSGIAVDSAGANLYIIENGNRSIRKIVIKSGLVTTIAGTADSEASLADGTGAGARFHSPERISIDSAGSNLYVADKTIRKINPILTFKKTLNKWRNLLLVALAKT